MRVCRSQSLRHLDQHHCSLYFIAFFALPMFMFSLMLPVHYSNFEILFQAGSTEPPNIEEFVIRGGATSSYFSPPAVITATGAPSSVFAPPAVITARTVAPAKAFSTTLSNHVDKEKEVIVKRFFKSSFDTNPKVPEAVSIDPISQFSGIFVHVRDLFVFISIFQHLLKVR
jgi:hypothetical protein